MPILTIIPWTYFFVRSYETSRKIKNIEKRCLSFELDEIH